MHRYASHVGRAAGPGRPDQSQMFSAAILERGTAAHIRSNQGTEALHPADLAAARALTLRAPNTAFGLTESCLAHLLVLCLDFVTATLVAAQVLCPQRPVLCTANHTSLCLLLA